MASITYWNRVEPSPRSNSLASALTARVRDPLWFLTRQWQFGEFQGADAGSPAWLEYRTTSQPITAWRPRNGVLLALDIRQPLEKVVASESFTLDLARSVEIGQLFEQLLDDAALPALIKTKFRDAYGIKPPTAAELAAGDEESVRFKRVVAGRALDGTALYRATFLAQPGLPADPPVPGQEAPVLAVLSNWLTWVQQVMGPLDVRDAPAWRPSRLEYDFELTTAGANPTLYGSTGGANIELDWDAFDVRGEAPDNAPVVAPEAPAVRTVMPANVQFRGMPNARWWDFENGLMDFGAIDTERRDLARLIVIDFMLVQGNDWFVIPLEQKVGTVLRVESVVVRDVFGTFTSIAAADTGWTMFSSTAAQGHRAEFVLPPTAGAATMYDEAIEDVRVLRDEMSNMVWAIEHTIEGGVGQGLPGYERAARRAAKAPVPPAAQDDSKPPLHYRLQTKVPENWIPFLPVAINPAHGDIALERAAMLDDAAQPILPVGRILNPALPAGTTEYRLEEEEVPRAGLRVERIVGRARGIRGETYLWIARRKRAGRGEGSSGLRFDLAEPNT